jgi:hypothetical protein
LSGECKYITHTGEVINLDNIPYLMKSVKPLLSYSKQAATAYGDITDFSSPDISETQIVIQTLARSRAELVTLKSALVAAFRSDRIAKKAGRIYVNGYTRECYVAAESVDERWYTDSISTFTVMFAKNSSWIKEVKTEAFSQATASDGDGESYPHGYPFGYPNPTTQQSIVNPSALPSAFRLIINGEWTNPTITIAGHIYNVNVVLGATDKLIIDSIKRTIVKVAADGTETNCFSLRNKDADKKPFEKIPIGESTVAWTGEHTFFITLIDEGDAPVWI